MNFNPFNRNQESSFEQGLPVTKTIKKASDQAQKQSQQVTNDIVAQLYGVTDKASGDDASGKSQGQKSPSAAVPQQTSSKFPGLQTPDEIARYQQLQQQLKGEGKSDEEIKAKTTHSQNYFRPTIGTVEDEMEKEKRKRDQKEMERKRQFEEEAQQKKQADAESTAEVPRPQAKGRNRMGGKKQKTDMGLKMGQMKTETFRGSSG